MTRRALNESLDPAKEAEIEKLIAEQSADDTNYVSQNGAVSLDAALQTSEGDGATLAELHGDDDRRLVSLVGEYVEEGSDRKKGVVTSQRIREWVHLRNKRGWTYESIADHAGVTVQTVRRHIASRSKYGKVSAPRRHLLDRVDELRKTYEDGAFLREIAQVHYEAAGYKTWDSCYQALREIFLDAGVQLRPKSAPRHGMRSRDATPAEQRAYWKWNNQRAVERRQRQLTRCDAVTKEGRPCRRWALQGGRYCHLHDDRPSWNHRWTRERILEALRQWANENARPPRARDWQRATEVHPAFKTVTDMFGKWNFALYEAGLRKRKHPKQRKEARAARLRKGYKPCAREGCKNIVPPTWRYCRSRQCQDARTAAVWGRPSPEQAQELVAYFGTQVAAAEAVGVSQPAISQWLRQEG